MKILTISAFCLTAFSGSAQAEIKAGDLIITDPFTRATLPNAPVGGGFLTIINKGDSDDRLVAATTEISNATEVHEMKMVENVMQMREVDDGLVIPAGEEVVLEPGGYHLMFLDLQQPLVEGEVVNVTLTFEDAGKVDVALPIGAVNARSASGHGDHSAHEDHSGHNHGDNHEDHSDHTDHDH